MCEGLRERGGHLGQGTESSGEVGWLGRLVVTADAGVGPDALALAAALAQPVADVVLSGASSVAQLHANLAAAAYSGPVPDVVPEDPAVYWAERAAMAWS